MATVTKGFLTRMGFAPAAGPWGTPRLLGATHQKEYASESLTPDSQLIPDDQIAGKATQLFGDKGNEFHSGDVTMDLKYEGLEDVIALAMGDANAGGAPTQVGGDNAYKHILKVADSKEGKFGTLVLDKTLEVWEYPTVKINGFTLDAVNGRRARITFPKIPQGMNINGGSGTNNTTTVNNLTLPANRDFALFAELAIRMNAHDGGALANSDLVYVSEFHLTCNNNFPSDDVTTRYGNKVDEPVQDGYSQFTGSIVFSKYMTENKAWMTKVLDKSRVKMDVKWTGRLAHGTSFFSHALYLPDVQFATGAPNVGGAGRVPWTIAFRCNRRTAVPTGFPATYMDAVTWDIVNQRSTNALATS